MFNFHHKFTLRDKGIETNPMVKTFINFTSLSIFYDKIENKNLIWEKKSWEKFYYIL